MKKGILAAFILTAALAVSGCGHDEDESSTKAASTAQITEDTTEVLTTEQTTTVTTTQTVSISQTETSVSTQKASETEVASQAGNADFKGLAGYWYIDGDFDKASLHIYEDGKFETFYATGAPENNGYIKYEFDDVLNNYYYAMYSENGIFIMSFADDGEKDKTDIYIGNEGTPHFVKMYGEGGLGDDGKGSVEAELAYNYVGTWDCERAHLTIEDRGEGIFKAVLKWSDSAFAYAEWDYPLIFDGEKMLCDENGKYSLVEYDQETGTYHTDTISENKSAEFVMLNGEITWNDLTDHRGDGMVFRKAE